MIFGPPKGRFFQIFLIYNIQNFPIVIIFGQRSVNLEKFEVLKKRMEYKSVNSS